MYEIKETENLQVSIIQGASAEVELVKGSQIRLTTDPSMENLGTAQKIFVDYKNITKVISVGSRIFVDDGLISLIVNSIGKLSFSDRTKFMIYRMM